MKKHRMSWRLAAILVAGWLLAACGPMTGGDASPTPEAASPVAETGPIETLPPPAEPGAGDKCGDGVCDQAEQEDPNLCPQDCEPTAPPPEEPTTAAPLPDTPAPGAETPRPGGRCGDGICDELEQNDPNLCPEDCDQAAGPAEIPASGEPAYEPPINVFLSVHNDSDFDYETNSFRTTPTDYQRSYDDINWLMQEAARHDMRFTILLLGWYPKWAMEKDDLSQFEALLAAGHEIGTHVHPVTYDPDQDLWIGWPDKLSKFGRPAYDGSLANQAWDDSYRFTAAVLDAIGATGQNGVVGPFIFKCSDEGQLLSRYGFAAAAGDRSEVGTTYFGHTVWNPWRPAANDELGHEIEEDLNATFLSIDHYAQIGAFQEVHPVDLSIPQLKRHFLMLYTEWLSRERTGAEDRTWVFGFVYHPNYTDKYHADLVEFLDWLDAHFIGRISPHGNVVARYATLGQIVDEHHAWEAAHPGVSSFSYVRGAPYPYTYATVAAKLEDAAYEAHVDLGQGVSCFRFSKGGQPIYMLWSDAGELAVDFSSQLSGQVRVTNAAGQEGVQDAAALALSEDPLFVEP
jgi:hypothetical protein